MKKKTKTILAGTGIAAACTAVVGTVSWLMTKILVGLALDKKAPVKMEGCMGLSAFLRKYDRSTIQQ